MRPELEKAAYLLRRPSTDNVQAALRLLQDTVFSFSMKLCGHREDAEDTMQDVLTSSLRHLAKIEDPRALSVWLYTAARNRCWQNRRKAARRKSVSLEDLVPTGTEIRALFTESGANPEQQALRNEDYHLIHEAVLKLPPPYRIVLVLHDMEELDTEQTAQVLSLQPGTVRVRLHRARLLLRKEMDAVFRQNPKRRRHREKSKKTQSKECKEIFGNLSEYLDGRMEIRACEQMRAYIEACPPCVAFIRDLKLAIDRCRSLKVPAWESTNTSLRRLLAEEYLRLMASGPSKTPAALAS